MGIEPTSEAWEASVLPPNYARSLFYVSSVILKRKELFYASLHSLRLLHGECVR